MCIQADFAEKWRLTWSKTKFVSRDDPLSRTSHSLLFERPRSYLFLFLQSSMSATRRRLVHVYAGSKVSTERRMDHALCIIHHVIGSLSDSTPCRCYRVPRHGTARHGLVKHKHRETINKRNVARIPRYVSFSRWNPTEGKMSSSSPYHVLSSSRVQSSLFLILSWSRDSVPFRFCLLVYEGNAIHPRPW